MFLAIHAAAATELGIDAERATSIKFTHYSEQSPFHALANDARAIALHLTVRGLGCAMADVARAAGVSRQVVSKQLQRADELIWRRPAQKLVIERLARIIEVDA